MNKFYVIAAILAVIIINSMSYDDEQLEQVAYCKAVAEGVHSNYKNVECEK